MNSAGARAAIGGLVGLVGTAITLTVTTYTDVPEPIVAVWVGVYLGAYRAIEAIYDATRSG